MPAAHQDAAEPAGAAGTPARRRARFLDAHPNDAIQPDGNPVPGSPAIANPEAGTQASGILASGILASGILAGALRRHRQPDVRPGAPPARRADARRAWPA